MPETRRYIPIELNPEPWAVGTLGVGRKGGKPYPYMAPNPQYDAYKEAVREFLAGAAPLVYENLQLEFYFWRRLDQYKGPSGRTVTKKAADATNLQKGLEDSLQGILFKNDRDVRKITSEVVAQGIDVIPGIVVVAFEYEPTMGVEDFLARESDSDQLSKYEQPTLPFGDEEVF